jgi:hypothetical protein
MSKPSAVNENTELLGSNANNIINNANRQHMIPGHITQLSGQQTLQQQQGYGRWNMQQSVDGGIHQTVTMQQNLAASIAGMNLGNEEQQNILRGGLQISNTNHQGVYNNKMDFRSSSENSNHTGSKRSTGNANNSGGSGGSVIANYNYVKENNTFNNLQTHYQQPQLTNQQNNNNKNNNNANQTHTQSNNKQ